MSEHEVYMQRCLRLAESGRQNTAPNPMVGAVIVHEGNIIGEGFHKEYGQPHAEVEAIQSVRDKSLLRNATMYVSLEPCCHFGKTPPCTSLIIEHGIPHVVVATTDPNPKVAGNGIRTLREAGIHVTENILKEEADKLNIRFHTFHIYKRPYVILKWAQSADGCIDKIPRNSSPEINWISNESSKQLVHKWRAEEAAILIGSQTAMNDNPSLTTRLWPGKNPLRLIIDPMFETPLHFNIFNAEAETICFHSSEAEKPQDFPQRIQCVPLNMKQSVPVQVLTHLYSENINSLIVEGGRFTLNSFIETGLWDEARVITGNIIFEKGILAPELKHLPQRTETIENDIIHYYINKNK